MNNLVLIDSSILCEWFQIPGKSTQGGGNKVKQWMQAMLKEGTTFYLPVASVVEVGNHISHVADGQQRRSCAQRFVALLQNCLNATRPYATIPYWEAADMCVFVDRFVQNATTDVGFGDTTIIHDYEKLCESKPTALSVRIWSLDGHLDAYSCKRNIIS